MPVSTAIAVQKWFIAQGFGIGDTNGMESPSLTDTPIFSLLYQDPEIKPTTWLWGLIVIKPYRRHVANVHLGDWFQTTPSDTWVIEVHGEKYLPLMERLANELSVIHQKTVEAKLVDTVSQREAFLRDFNRG